MSSVHILSVSQLASKVRFLLESELNTVWLTGEISNLVMASSGHWYLTLKDSKSQVKCAMFRGQNLKSRLTPSNGMQVLVRAKVSLYEPRGDFQLILEHMEPAGEGLLRQQFEQLKQQLYSQGYFDAKHKKVIPEHIKTLGVVTSPTGAAIRDIISVLKNRNPNIKVIIYPALVQGEHAAKDIAAAIAIANQRAECEVLIVGRGGGSLEDLWCFNEIPVIEAIFASSIPVVSAVGHEIDITLTDYVADKRAATPSQGAELVSQDSSAMVKQLHYYQQQLTKLAQHAILQYQHKLQHISHQLKLHHPKQQWQFQQQKLDELSQRLERAYNAKFQQYQQQVNYLAERITSVSPQQQIHAEKNTIIQLEQRLINAQQHQLIQAKNRFSHSVENLHLVSPLATLARGYSIVRDNQQNIIKSSKQVIKDQPVTIQMHDGNLIAKVVEN